MSLNLENSTRLHSLNRIFVLCFESIAFKSARKRWSLNIDDGNTFKLFPNDVNAPYFVPLGWTRPRDTPGVQRNLVENKIISD